MQYFKGDETEKKFYNSGKNLFDTIEFQLDQMFLDVYNAQPLGDALYQADASPLANAIPQSIFRKSFNKTYDAFTVSGTFESYIEVFKRVFGDDVDVTFTVPAAGQLEIDIVASDLEVNEGAARQIELNTYVLYELMTQDDDNIVFQTVKGFKTQYELEQMLFELVPEGIYTTISLTVGS